MRLKGHLRAKSSSLLPLSLHRGGTGPIMAVEPISVFACDSKAHKQERAQSKGLHKCKCGLGHFSLPCHERGCFVHR